MNLLSYWREILLAVLGVSLFLALETIKGRNQTIEKLNTEIALKELQKEALRKAILDQNEAVEKQRIDAEIKAKQYKEASAKIVTKYKTLTERIEVLKPDEECDVMKELIEEAVK